jgi:Spy/CpxP family protein refolding chaperone
MSPQERDAHQLEMLTKHLNLTDAQQAQIKQIFADSDAKMKAAHDNAGAGDKKDMREQMKAAMEDRQSKVRAVLTPDQQKKYDEMVAKMKERMGEHHDHGGPGGGGDNPPPPPPAQ